MRFGSSALPAFKPTILLSHLLLVHNLSPAWDLKINQALWSVATEWQIYFFFPLVLLPMQRRYGPLAPVWSGFALGSAAPLLLNRFWTPHPWFLGLFALGMWAADLEFSTTSTLRAHFDSKRWILVTNLMFLVLALFIAMPLLPFCYSLTKGDTNWFLSFQWAVHGWTGIATALLLVWCTRCVVAGEQANYPLILRLCEARWAVALGEFSYSLYLIHVPLLALMVWAWRASLVADCCCSW